MQGKEKCKILKQIRKEIAKQNNIDYIVDECKHQGNCKGTCPKCESEVRYLEAEIEKKKKAGKAVALVGVSAACIGMLTACTPEDVITTVKEHLQCIESKIQKEKPTDAIDIAGEIEYIPDDLSGYIAPEPEPEPQTDDVITLDGEVAIEDYR